MNYSDYLKALSIQPWKLKVQLGSDPWNDLHQQVSICKACELSHSRTQTVFGSGNPNADIMFIGEAPGFHEDQQGLPFVGRAGQLLTAMLKSIQLQRDEVYIANILKCRPPNNRDPSPEEVRTCTRYLNEQISHIKPKILVALGRISAQYLLQSKQSLESLRGKIHQYGDQGIPLVMTYHPAYLLRNPADKKKSYADLCFIKETIESMA